MICVGVCVMLKLSPVLASSILGTHSSPQASPHGTDFTFPLLGLPTVPPCAEPMGKTTQSSLDSFDFVGAGCVGAGVESAGVGGVHRSHDLLQFGEA